MRRVAVGAMLAALCAVPALADMTAVDTNGDGMATYEELVVVYTALTAEEFAAMDTNQDGMLDEAEMTAAMDAGTLVAG